MTLSHNLLAKRSRRRRLPSLRPAPFLRSLGFLSHVSGSALTKRGMDGQFDERVDPRGLAGGIRKPVGGNNSFRGRRRRKIPMCQTDVCKSSAAAALKSDVSGDVGTREILLNCKARTAIIAGSTESEVDWLNILQSLICNLNLQRPVGHPSVWLSWGICTSRRVLISVSCNKFLSPCRHCRLHRIRRRRGAAPGRAVSKARPG